MTKRQPGNALKRKRRLAVLIPAAVLLLSAAAGAVGLNVFVARLSDPAPLPPADRTGKVVLCLGDSLTRGNSSANYVEELSRRLTDDGAVVVNAGINGDMVHDVLARLDDVLRASPEPDVITILIGTNDANATLDPCVAERALEHPAMGWIPTKPVYRSLYIELIDRLRESSEAPIILISIPPIGEIPGSLEWTRSAEYASVTADIAAAEKCAYVPYFETLAALIEADPPDPSAFPPHSQWSAGMKSAVFKHHILGRNYGEIGAAAGYRFHSDQLHLNERAARILADSLESEIRKALAGR